MAVDLSQCLVIGISSRALFDLDRENRIYQQNGLRAYEDHQRKNENEILRPGTGFPLVKALLNLNDTANTKRRTEVVIMSRNSAETSLRIFNSIKHYGLDISRAALSGGAPLAPYIDAFKVDLFLSMDESDVQTAVNAGIAAAVLYAQPRQTGAQAVDQIRIAFDGDAVLFSDEAERIFQTEGLEAFQKHELENARKPLPEGPFAKLLKTLSAIQAEYRATTIPESGDTHADPTDRQHKSPIRTALVTARNSPAHERIIRTLRAWNVALDETFFLGGMSKSEVLKAFHAHIFFDDQNAHCDHASRFVPTGRVPVAQRTAREADPVRD